MITSEIHLEELSFALLYLAYTGTIGFIISTALISIFGEVVPTIFCSRYALCKCIFTSGMTLMHATTTLETFCIQYWARSPSR